MKHFVFYYRHKISYKMIEECVYLKLDEKTKSEYKFAGGAPKGYFK
jgi:hypothetical protein